MDFKDLKQGDKISIRYGSKTRVATVLSNIVEHRILVLKIKFNWFSSYTTSFPYISKNLQLTKETIK